MRLIAPAMSVLSPIEPALAATAADETMTRAGYEASNAVVITGQRGELDRSTHSSKTGTSVSDVPASIQVIPREVLEAQGATMLRESLGNASGVNVGGQDTKGFYDHFLIRGLNAQVFEDGFSDGDQLGGVSHSLNGVERIEIFEGPGSALFGSGPPGGTINILHYSPSNELHYGARLEIGSYGTVLGNSYGTGQTGITNLAYRVDATFDRATGFRHLESRDAEARPALEWAAGSHRIWLSLDLRNIHETPDSYGIIYFAGSPMRNVPLTAKYSSSFATAHTNFVRPELTDEWTVSRFLTINNRFSFLHRTQSSLGNGDSSSTKVSGIQVIGRQLRQQSDDSDSLDYQVEPVWHFTTGPIRHTLLTGFEYQDQRLSTSRSTADLPNILDAFAPVPLETSPAGLKFQCDSKHSCDDDRLNADYYGAYAIDQIDFTGRLKFRAGVRQDWFETTLTPRITVPGRFGADGSPLVAGITDKRSEAPVSWNLAILYKLTNWASPYAGVSKSHLVNFNSENTQSGLGAAESALEHETGIKFAFLDDRLLLNAAAFRILRDNVPAAVTLNGIEVVVFDSQRTVGAEGSLNAQLTSNWQLIANFTAQDAVITSNPQGISAVGRHPQGVPARIANFWTSYSFDIGAMRGFRVGAGLNYQSRSYSDLTNRNSIPPSLIANASIAYEHDHWGVDLNIHNLTNRRYYIAANGAGALVGQPLSAFLAVHAGF